MKSGQARNYDRTNLSACILGGLLVFLMVTTVSAQELEPRAYASTPVGLKAFFAAYSISDGSVLFDPTLPIEDVTATVNGTGMGYFQSINFFGRSANVNLVVPYAWGSMEGLLAGNSTRITRSGLADPRFRFTFNLFGAPGMKPREFARYRQKTNIGLGLAVAAPLGQYDPNKLINLGANRWAFKPELGLSHRRNRWLLEMAIGAWIFTDNKRFLGTSKREQDAVFSLQGHVIYALPKRMWVGFNANFFRGGSTYIDDRKSAAPSLRNSRLGATFSVPIYRRHSVRISYDDGVITRLGTDFSRLSITYQFIWLGLR